MPTPARAPLSTISQSSLFFKLQSRQSIWQFSGTVRPPLLHGVMWSACISSNSKCFPQYGHTPFWRSYAARASRLSKARMLSLRSLPVSRYS